MTYGDTTVGLEQRKKTSIWWKSLLNLDKFSCSLKQVIASPCVAINFPWSSDFKHFLWVGLLGHSASLADCAVLYAPLNWFINESGTLEAPLDLNFNGCWCRKGESLLKIAHEICSLSFTLGFGTLLVSISNHKSIIALLLMTQLCRSHWMCNEFAQRALAEVELIFQLSIECFIITSTDFWSFPCSAGAAFNWNLLRHRRWEIRLGLSKTI